MRLSLREAGRLFHRDVLGAGELRHPLDPAGDTGTAGGLRRKVDEPETRALVGRLFDLDLAAVVERAPHLRRFSPPRLVLRAARMLRPARLSLSPPLP